MNPRFALFALVALALAGCNEDPQVIAIQISTGGVSIDLSGGNATTTSATAVGTGGAGGVVDIRSIGDLKVGGSTVAPSKPTAPVAPAFSATTGADVTFPAAPGTGNLFVRNTLTTPGGPETISTSNGDIVVTGTLRAGAPADTLTLSAPAGTVYISGKIITSTTGVGPNGNAGAIVLINAARIVVTGTIDTRGQSVLAGIGGDGGDVTLDTTGSAGGSAIFMIGGTLNTAGGSGRTQGGQGGSVVLLGSNTVHAYGTITTSGGAATSSASDNNVLGGDAGSLDIAADGSVDLLSTLVMAGGNASTNGDGALGGDGGILNFDGPGAGKIYSTFVMKAGTARANLAGGGLVGGAGGQFLVGVGTKTSSVEIGRGTILADAGDGPGAGGAASAASLDSEDGTFEFGCVFSTKGGNATGTGPADGGAGGDMTFQTDSVGSGTHSLSILITAKLDTSGGAGVGTGDGKLGGTIRFRAAGDVVLDAVTVTTLGGDSPSGDGGAGGAVRVEAPLAGNPLGDLQVSGLYALGGGTSAGASSLGGLGGAGGEFNLACPGPNGEIVSTAIVTTSGGQGAQAGDGGTAGKIVFLSVSGGITSSGNLTALGGAGNPGTGKGGGGNDITFDTTNGSIVVSGTLVATGGSGTGAASGAAGKIHLAAATDGSVIATGTWTSNGGGNLTSTASAGGILELFAGSNSGIVDSSAHLTASGGSSIAVSSLLVAGGGGGSLDVQARSASGTITLETGSAIVLDGGSSTGTALAGGGGTASLSTNDLFISMSGSIRAKGGAALGSGGGGGLGGQVTVWSNANNDTACGDITLQSGGTIDVSAGTGTVGNSARNNVTPGTVTPGGALVAVTFDASGDLTTTAGLATDGQVQNLGSITANGSGAVSVGGDVYFDGRTLAGGAATTPTPGTMTLSGGSATGDFDGD